MSVAKILWVDDEIESLTSQIMFLENKGYEVAVKTNGFDAVEYVKDNIVDVVLLDETMPGITGLQTLQQIKELNNTMPVVLITKNEAENLMDEAIGSQISDYLIKPVNPNQVWLSLKKLIDNKRLVAEKTTTAYQQEFRNLFIALNNNPDYNEWMELYKKLVYWELEMKKSDSPELQEVFQTQKQEANTEFFKFISKNYASWVAPKSVDGPIMSNSLLKYKVLPHLEKGTPLFFVLIDNLRFDQWKAIQHIFAESFRILDEDTFYAILPTATQYARNAIFAGMLPIDIEKNFSNQWKNDDEEGGKNLHEEEFLKEQLKRNRLGDIKFSYTKITNNNDGQKLVENMHNLLQNDFNVIVYNFVDMLSHARTEMEVLKELAGDETSYRSITMSWFEHSPLHQALKKIADKNINLIIATDHGSTRVKTPVKVIGDKQTTANLRYKHGRNLNYDEKDVLAFRNPKDAGLPVPTVNSSFIFAKGDLFLCYPNNYNHFVHYYKNTFQHGGISLDEMIVPVVRMSSK
ncbi:MAG TPA: PglZ domain-containing protein [Ferruginibacter sp.]|jgi:CheY-like chemotaxis protein|nr:PglZ domain-containing protein [Chitinophagaceae bacterium]MBP6988402.1 PglZ domain-containing protein [Ferruginibacter sp.]NMD29182.1 bifunctional response regulator/alkaline phosphatase family protein [Bacteroidota bacterium]MBK8774255.1 PglZ domain-containing protein [Chitinophagaceae bacterium]MBK8929909.1 PglZ domain-containing protein [Chitinophagaceae bacterium]